MRSRGLILATLAFFEAGAAAEIDPKAKTENAVSDRNDLDFEKFTMWE